MVNNYTPKCPSPLPRPMYSSPVWELRATAVDSYKTQQPHTKGKNLGTHLGQVVSLGLSHSLIRVNETIASAQYCCSAIHGRRDFPKLQALVYGILPSTTAVFSVQHVWIKENIREKHAFPIVILKKFKQTCRSCLTCPVIRMW